MNINQPPMTEHERATYTRFIEWLKQSWYGVPDSDVLLPYVAARYTPEEALLLTGMPFAPNTLAELSELTKTSADVLRPKLDSLTSKGLVYKQVKENRELYYLNDIFFIYRSFGWPGHSDEYDQLTGPLQHKYLTDGLMSPWKDVKEKGLRHISHRYATQHRLKFGNMRYNLPSFTTLSASTLIR